MRRMSFLPYILVVLVVLLAATASAQNLIVNPDFDLDPTIPGNGWTAIGTGILSWNEGTGDPDPPSARTEQSDTESMILCQCVEILGGRAYDFSARSYTHAAIGSASNGVSLSVYESVDCSGSPIETTPTDQSSFPDWALREYEGYISPPNALSARIELHSDANGDIDNVSWDNVKLTVQPLDARPSTWGGIKALYR